MHKRITYGLALCGLLAAAPAWSQPAVRAPRASLGVAVEATREADRTGVVIRRLDQGGPAAKAGLKEGDVIVKVGDKDVRDYDTLVNTIAGQEPGAKLNFQILRDGKEQSVTVTLGERQPRRPEGTPDARPQAFLGVQTQPLTPTLRERLGVAADGGVLVTDVVPNTPAAKAGLKQEDVITAVDGKNIADPAQLREAIQKAGTGKEITLAVVRGKERRELKAQLEETPGDVIAVPRLPPGFPPIERPGAPIGEPRRVQELDRRIEQLERRVRELEQKRPQPDK